MTWWLERLITSLTKNSSRAPVSGDEQNGEILTEEPSIFSQMYEVNGCYKCSLRTTGLGLGSYRCEVIFMEKQLIVLHLVSRNSLNVSRILAPIAATAFAASFNEGRSKVSRGEWIVLPFDHITMIELQNQGKEANIVTKTGTSYTLGDNEECVSKAFGIFNERRDAESNGELSRGTGEEARSHCPASLRQAESPISSRPDIGEQSLAEAAPLANTFPGCIRPLLRQVRPGPGGDIRADRRRVGRPRRAQAKPRAAAQARSLEGHPIQEEDLNRNPGHLGPVHGKAPDLLPHRLLTHTHFNKRQVLHIRKRNRDQDPPPNRRDRASRDATRSGMRTRKHTITPISDTVPTGKLNNQQHQTNRRQVHLRHQTTPPGIQHNDKTPTPNRTPRLQPPGIPTLPTQTTTNAPLQPIHDLLPPPSHPNPSQHFQFLT
ncbi:hypothetical protein OIY81_2143 [Cryptosporidium canis]|nr:hypothetical protein OIY81_2143 [Cryptosporidium canis]